MTRGQRLALIALGAWLAAAGALYAAVPRQGEATGTIVDARGDEEIQFVAEANWRAAEIEQGLLAGDHLRTGPAGLLALRFIDQTLIRVHRNTELVIKQLGGGAETQLQLDQGQVWAREATGGSNISISTPSATAAIRGTDWSLLVDAAGKTTLTVSAGQVELRNEFGQVLVGPGEAAIAEVGRAPTKVFLAQKPGREQMLYYLDSRTALTLLPVSDLGSTKLRTEGQRLRQKGEDSLTDEERISLIESELTFGSAVEAERLRQPLSGRALSPDLVGRVRLIDGLIAARRMQWDDAAAAFGEAAPNLAGRRHVSAVFGRYLTLIFGGRAAEAAAMKAEVDALPDDPGTTQILAVFEATTGESEAAIVRLDAAEQRYPDMVEFPIIRGLLAVVLADEEAARAASERADAVDPEHPSAAQLRAAVLSDFDWDLKAAQTELEQALELNPRDEDLWNSLGLLRSDQGDAAGARAAFEEAIRLDPNDLVPHANLAIVYLDANMMDEAREQIDIAKAMDPSFYIVHVAEGRWLIQKGDIEGAKREFLDAVAADPQVAESSLGLAITYYQNRQIELALQALDDAERLDPDDPAVPYVRTVIALNEANAGEAIRAAKETYRRYQQRGSAFNKLASARSDGSYLFSAFDNLSLSDWGRFYGDRLFNPFDSASHFYQSAILQPPVTADGIEDTGSFSEAIQGLLLEPLASSGRNRYDDLFRRPFFDVTFGSNLLLDRDGVLGGGAFADLEAFMNDGPPFAIAANLAYETADEDSLAIVNDTITGTMLAGVELGLSDRLFMFATVSDGDDVNGSTLGLGLHEDFDNRSYSTGIGFSHTFGESNVMMGLLGANGSHGDGEINSFDAIDNDEDSGLLALTHLIDIEGVTLRYGVEGQLTKGQTTIFGLLGSDGDAIAGRIYLDATTEVAEDLNLQLGAYVSHFQPDASEAETRFDPRVGLSWQPVEGQWLRVGFRQDTTLPLGASLAPDATVGLVPFATPTADGGKLQTFAARWDAEWTDRFFTSLEYQHQEIDDFAVSFTDTSIFSSIFLGSLAAQEGHLDMVSLSANVWLTDQFGAFVRGTFADSENEDNGRDLPLVPDWTANVGITWVHPAQIRVSLVENIIGQRDGDLAGTELSTDATTDFTVSWEPLDKHLALGASVLNIFDEKVEIAKDPIPLFPTYQTQGLTFRLSGEVRF
jgi:tetratricopeptide (TPR) repeat protein